jgi:Protein of unknown function (DUF2796)
MKQFNILFIVSLFFTASATFSKEHHDAHEHGKADLDIAVDGSKVQMMFHAPAESIYGFEHEAKSKKDIAARTEAQRLIETKTLVLFQFDSTLGCKTKAIKVDPWVREEHEEHGELHAQLEFQCEKPVAGTKLIVTLTKSFQKLREIAVQYISDKKQTGLTLTSKVNSFEL